MLKRSGFQLDTGDVLCNGIFHKLQEQQESLGDVEQQCKRIRLELDSAFDMLNLSLFNSMKTTSAMVLSADQSGRGDRVGYRSVDDEDLVKRTLHREYDDEEISDGHLSRSQSEDCLQTSKAIERRRLRPQRSLSGFEASTNYLCSHLGEEVAGDDNSCRVLLSRRCRSIPTVMPTRLVLLSNGGGCPEKFEEEIHGHREHGSTDPHNIGSYICEPIDLSVQPNKQHHHPPLQSNWTNNGCHGNSHLFYPSSVASMMAMSTPPLRRQQHCSPFAASFADCLQQQQQQAMSTMLDNNNGSLDQFIQVDASQNIKWRELAERYAKDLAPNICGICGKTLSCKSALTMHYRVHTEERPFVCKICRKRFSTKGNLKTHLGQHGDTIDPVKPEPVSLLPPLPFGGLQCSNSFTFPIAASNEASGNSEAMPSPAAAAATANTINTILSMRHQQEVFHREPPTTNTATAAAFSPAAKETEEEDYGEEEEEEEEEDYEDERDRFDINTSHAGHILMAHQLRLEGQRPSTTTSPLLLSAAAAAAAAAAGGGGLSRRREYSCDTCNKVFPTKSALQIHNRSHTGEKPFTCTDCGKPFSTQGNMKTHREKHCPSRRHKDPSGVVGSIGLLNKPANAGLHLPQGCIGGYPGTVWPHITHHPAGPFVGGDLWGSFFQHQHQQAHHLQHHRVGDAQQLPPGLLPPATSSPFSPNKALQLNLSGASGDVGGGAGGHHPQAAAWFLPPPPTVAHLAVYPPHMMPPMMAAAAGQQQQLLTKGGVVVSPGSDVSEDATESY